MCPLTSHAVTVLFTWTPPHCVAQTFSPHSIMKDDPCDLKFLKKKKWINLGENKIENLKVKWFNWNKISVNGSLKKKLVHDQQHHLFIRFCKTICKQNIFFGTKQAFDVAISKVYLNFKIIFRSFFVVSLLWVVSCDTFILIVAVSIILFYQSLRVFHAIPRVVVYNVMFPQYLII